MKKTVIVALFGLMALAISPVARAQFGAYGAQAGIGLATVKDELNTHTWPVTAYTIGGHINYEFGDIESALTDHFFLQSGLNLMSRGHKYQYVYQLGTDMWLREGNYTAWYLQLPILACFNIELPIRQADHVVGIFAGPAVEFGLFGPYQDRKVHPGKPQREENYDLSIDGDASARDAFSHINRLDVSLLFGLSYTHGDWSARLYVDHGFLATSTGEDVLRLNDQANATSQAERDRIRTIIPNGHNTSFMLSVSYAIGTLNKK